jgi:integrase
MAKRRGWGEGSVYPRCGRKGPGHEQGNHRRCRVDYWVGQVDVGRCSGGHERKDGSVCPGGERIRPRVVRKTKTGENGVLAGIELLKRQKTSGIIGGNKTIAEYARWWLLNVKGAAVEAGDLSPNSLEKYQQRFDNWILPYLGSTRLRRLTVEQVQKWQNDLAAKDIGPDSRSSAKTSLSSMMRYAIGARAIEWNPVEFVATPKTEHRTDDAFETEEAEAVLTAAKGDRLEGLYRLAVRYGMRQDELLSLPEDAHDYKKATLKVGKSKTEAGKRKLPLLREENEALQARKVQRAAEKLAAGPAWEEHGLLFCKPDGRPIHPVQLRNLWTALLKRAKVTHKCSKCGTDKKECSSSVRRFHASRHTAATLLLEAGVPLEVVSAILGHSGIKITADVYAKVRTDLMRRGILKLDVLPRELPA